MNTLQPLLNPRSIAILGASADPAKVSGRPLKFLLAKRYAGKIFPVNPKYPRIGDLVCYPDVASLPEAADLAIVAVPAPRVAAEIRELGRRGIRSAVVFSSGFGEMGAAGAAMERELVDAARESGLRLFGPNCLGLLNAFDNVMATFGQFADGPTPQGPVGFVTQSGAFGTAIAALARRRGLGLGYFINTGNEGDVEFSEMLGAVIEDPRIKVAAGYIEGLRNGARYVEVSQRALELGKPVVVTKVGRTDAGARAAASHTGSLAGADSVFDGVARGLGFIRARNEEHMLDIVEVFANCALPTGNGLGVVTQSGGAAVLMADRAEEVGLVVPVLSASTRERLAQVIPAFGTTANPVDVTGQFLAEPGLLRDSVVRLLEDPAVHVGIVWLQLMDAYVDVLIDLFKEIQASVTKPFVVSWVAAPESALKALREAGIAVLRGAEPAVDAVAALVRYAQARRDWEADRGARASLRVPESLLPSKPGVVGSLEARALLEAGGVTLAPARLARDAEEAVAAAQALGYPVALKIESADLPHKTEAGGVMLGLRDEKGVRAAYEQVTASARRYSPQAVIGGVLVQPMVSGEVELVVGLKHDPVFGVVVMVGLGGIHIEVLKDVVFRKAPVTPAEAGRMLNELKSRAILDGVRGGPGVDRDALSRFVSAVSCVGAAAGERLAELDLNPVLAGPRGVTGVDWLMVLR